jgi:perosamine synthetase
MSVPIIKKFTKIIVAKCNQGQPKKGVETGGEFMCDKLDIFPHFIINNNSFDNIDSETDNGYERLSTILEIYNRDVVSLHYKSFDSDIQQLLSDKVKIIPLIDDDGVIKEIASNLHLHNFSIMEPLLGGRELEYVTDCIKTNWISSQGKYVSNFEESLANKLGVPHSLVTSNGTTALHLALATLDIGIGDEVIVPNLTFGASVNSIMHSGAMPVLVDVEYGSWNLSPSAVRSAITPKTKAIMPVHIYGQPCKLDEIIKCLKHFHKWQRIARPIVWV